MAESSTKPKLTPKQIKFVKARAEGKTLKEAAMIAYPNAKTEATAKVIASENMTKPNILEAIQDAWEKNGLTMDAAAKALKDGLGATKTATEKGEVYSSDEPDHSVRIQAARTLVTLLNPGREGGGGNTFNFNFNTPAAEQEPKRSFIDVSED